jgi:hypothetical protein
MGEIQGQPLVADLNGDGYMEVRKSVTAITLKLQSRISKTSHSSIFTHPCH